MTDYDSSKLNAEPSHQSTNDDYSDSLSSKKTPMTTLATVSPQTKAELKKQLMALYNTKAQSNESAQMLERLNQLLSDPQACIVAAQSAASIGYFLLLEPYAISMIRKHPQSADLLLRTELVEALSDKHKKNVFDLCLHTAQTKKASVLLAHGVEAASVYTAGSFVKNTNHESTYFLAAVQLGDPELALTLAQYAVAQFKKGDSHTLSMLEKAKIAAFSLYTDTADPAYDFIKRCFAKADELIKRNAAHGIYQQMPDRSEFGRFKTKPITPHQHTPWSPETKGAHLDTPARTETPTDETEPATAPAQTRKLQITVNPIVEKSTELSMSELRAINTTLLTQLHRLEGDYQNALARIDGLEQQLAAVNSSIRTSDSRPTKVAPITDHETPAEPQALPELGRPKPMGAKR